MIQVARKGAAVFTLLALALAATACSSSSSSTTSTTSSPSAPAVSVPTISISDLNNSFSAMTLLKPLAAIGKGNVAAILPDTVSSARYTEFDAPYLSEAWQRPAFLPRSSPW